MYGLRGALSGMPTYALGGEPLISASVAKFEYGATAASPAEGEMNGDGELSFHETTGKGNRACVRKTFTQAAQHAQSAVRYRWTVLPPVRM